MKKFYFTFILLLVMGLFCACDARTASKEGINQCYICKRETSSQIYFDDYYGYGYLCADCFLSSPEDFIRCQDCGTVARNHWGDIQVCENCLEAYYRTCVLCDDRLFHRDEMARAGQYCLCAQCAFDLALHFDTEDEIIRHIEDIAPLPYSSFYSG